MSRIFNTIERYDIAIITAFRGKSEYCVLYPYNDENRIYTKSEKLDRNKILYSTLLKLKYGITKIDGSYIENFGNSDWRECKENSFFVVNLNNDSNFIKNIIKLGEYFCQDSVLLKPKNQKAYLYGTNYSDYPGYNKKFELGNFIGGIEAEFLSKIRNRPFIFREMFDSFEYLNNSGKYLVDKSSKPIIEFLKQ